MDAHHLGRAWPRRGARSGAARARGVPGLLAEQRQQQPGRARLQEACHQRHCQPRHLGTSSLRALSKVMHATPDLFGELTFCDAMQTEGQNSG